MTQEIQVLICDRHAYVAGLNRLMGSYPYPLYICYISMLSTVYCHISVCYTFTHKEISLTYHISLQSTLNARKISYMYSFDVRYSNSNQLQVFSDFRFDIVDVLCNDDNLSLEKIPQYRQETGKHLFLDFFISIFVIGFWNCSEDVVYYIFHFRGQGFLA